MLTFSSHRPVRASSSKNDTTGSTPMKLGRARTGVPDLDLRIEFRKSKVMDFLVSFILGRNLAFLLIMKLGNKPQFS